MGLITPQLPTLGQPSATEDADVLNSLTAIVAVINGALDASNIADGSLTEAELATALLDRLGITGGGVSRRGKSIIATTEVRSSAVYGTLTTPDQVTVALPVDGLIVAYYHALWKESVGMAGRAAFFLGANQVLNGAAGGAPVANGEAINTGAANLYTPLTSANLGLSCPASVTADSTDITTGQTIGEDIGSFKASGACTIFAAAGTYTLSVRFKASSGTVTVKDRKLWVLTMGF
jgi:hypothetical protein